MFGKMQAILLYWYVTQHEFRRQKFGLFYLKRSAEFNKLCPEAAAGGVLQEKMSLEISQNSQENNCSRVSSLIKLQV